MSVRQSAEHGLYLCADHLAAHKAALDEVRENAADERARQAYWEYEFGQSRTFRANENDRRRAAVEAARKEGRLVVYYVRIGDWVKIGTTCNFATRMSILQPDEILATEPGYLQLERLRLEQFKHLRIRPRSERHRQGQDLLDHIAMLRAHFGEPRGAFDLSLMPATA